jgi:hypothetical protein
MMKHFCLSSIILWLLCSSAFAQSNPSVQNSWAALFDPYMLPYSTRPINTGCAIDADFRIVNYLSYEDGAWGSINTDLERWQLTAKFKLASEYGEFSLLVPFQVLWSGILDVPLNAFHGLLGVGQSPIPSLSEIRIDLPGQPSRGVFAPVAGFGDPVIAWGANWDYGIWTRVSFGIPLADSQNFLGGGAWRIGLTAAYDATWGGIAIHAIVPLSSAPQLNGLGLRTSIGARLWARLPWNLPGKLEMVLQSSPISVGGKFANVMLTFHIIIGEFGSTQFSFVEDITATLPDVVLGANSSFVVGCPVIKP